jgi:hypothetical protein
MNRENKLKLLRGLKSCVQDLAKVAEEVEVVPKVVKLSGAYVDLSELKKLAGIE